MVTIPKYPKVLPLGHRTIRQIWDGPVEITEKVDGSQFGFAKINGEIVCKTRRTILYPEQPDKMFLPAVKQVMSNKDVIPEGVVFFGETLVKPKHNVLPYTRVPKGHIALFAAMNIESKEMYSYVQLGQWAFIFEMDIVPILWEGEVSDSWKETPLELVKDLLDTTSFLGGPHIEGIVVKNYIHDAMIGEGVYYPYLVGKYVSEKFKETAGSKLYGNRAAKSNWEAFKDSFRTEARWQKAIQHLREDGLLLGEPKDIGPLLKEIQTDLEDEEKETVMEFLYKLYRKEWLGRATQGFAEWYKEQLLKGEIE